LGQPPATNQRAEPAARKVEPPKTSVNPISRLSLHHHHRPSNRRVASTLPPSNRRSPSSSPIAGHRIASTMSLVNLAHVCSHLQNASKGRLGLTSVPLTKLHLAIALGLQREGFVSTVTIGGPQPPEMDELINPKTDPSDLPPELQARVPPPPQPTRPQSQELESVVDAVKKATGAPSPEESMGKPSSVSEADLESLLGSKIFQLYKQHYQRQSKRARAQQEKEQLRKDDPELHNRPLTKEALHALHIPLNPAQRRLWLGLKYWNNTPVISEMKLVSKPTKRITLDYRALAKITRGFQQGEVKGMTRPGECLFIGTDRGIMEAREAVKRQIGGLVYCRVV
jgi:ribosomal protein S8